MEAQFTLGNKYFEGDGVEKDLELATRLFAAAAQQGHMQASINLGKCQDAGVDFEKLIAQEEEEQEKGKAAALEQAEWEASPASGEVPDCNTGYLFRKAYEDQHKKD